MPTDGRRPRLSLVHLGRGREAARTAFDLCLPPQLLRPECVRRAQQLNATGWQRLCRAAHGLGVAPLLHHCLGEAQLLEFLPEGQREQLAALREAQGRHNREVLAGLADVFEYAAAHGWPMAVIKETALLGPVYPDIALRYQSDVDLLVDETQIEPMREFAAENVGEDTCDFKSGMYGARELWPLPLAHGAEMLGRAAPCEVAGVQGRCVAPADNLIWLCWHDFNHGWGVLPRLLDIIWLVEAHRNALQWDQVLERAERWGIAAALQPALNTARRAAGAGIPERVLSRLEEVSSKSWLRATLDLDLWLWPLEARQTQYWWHVARWHVIRDSVRAHRDGGSPAADRMEDRARRDSSQQRALRYAVGYCQARSRWLWRRLAGPRPERSWAGTSP